MLDSKRNLSPIWASVQLDDIGAGYKKATKSIAKQASLPKGKTKADRKIHSIYRRLHILESEDERRGRERHKFLNGNSRFIFYVLKPPVLIKKPKRKDVIERQAINAKTRIAPATRAKFASTLGLNIDRTTKFFVEEILPRTESLFTATANIDEIVQQITDDGAKLPMEFIRRKMTEAVHLRIVRFIGQQFNLTKEEQKLLLAEWIAKTKPPLF
jgi:hypothetical protein